MSERERLAATASIYENWTGIDNALTETVGQLILSRSSRRSGLELGWGAGVMNRILCSQFDILHVVEGDAAIARRANEATGRHYPAHRIFDCLFEDFKPECDYDDVIMSEVLEHVLGPGPLLRRAALWLRPGGRIHIAVPNGNSVHRLLGAMAGIGGPLDLGETDKRNGHRRVYTWDSIQAEVAAAGLEVVHMEGVLLKPFPGPGMNLLTAAERQRLFELAACCPKLCAEVYVECRNPESS